jgi:coenzyme F420-reducing hydrogenase beta subunit
MSELYSPGDIVRSGLCIGCGSCAAQADDLATEMLFDKFGELKPNGPKDWYTHKSELFTRTCPFSPAAKLEDDIATDLFPSAAQSDPHIGLFQTAYVGYAAEEDFRLSGSSGGMVSWVATELMKKGLVDGVAHVIATHDPKQEGRFFRYRISRTEAEVREGAKSRYYPIEMSEILKAIKAVPGRYAVVGIPCFIKAVHLLCQQDAVLHDRIQYTLGLFCGHMKSARFIESFAWQMNVPVSEVVKVEFRHKDPSRPANWYNAMLTLRDGTVVNKDWWHLADGDWGAGYFMNSACNYCDDVVAETADVSFGDAWLEPYSSDGRGTNVVIVRSAVVQELVTNAIRGGRLHLETVDSKFVVETQAAGFRQRREGVAYRLTWKKNGVKPRKRLAQDAATIPKQRKLIYRIRYYISAGSHRAFRLASRTGRPQIYIKWAKMAAAIYHGLAYHRGKIGEIAKRLGLS